MKCKTTITRCATFVFFMAALTTTADPLEIDPATVDGGGGTSIGGAFELSGTIGQPDAGVMIGGDFDLSGGFWPAAVPGCACLGDTNADGEINGLDIAKFVGCILNGGSCQCADTDGMSGVDLDDLDVFVADLLSGTGCP